MQRLLIFGLFLAPATPAAAQTSPELTVTGSFFSRYELRDNYDDIGTSAGRFLESDGVAYRARLGLATTPIDVGKGRAVTLRLAPQASGFWADSGNTLADGELHVHEAVLELAGASYRVQVGRFEMAYGEHLVIGNVGWHETGRSFDGARVRLTPGDSGMYVDAFVTQLAEGRALNVSPVGAGDLLFFGAYAGFGPALASALALDGYVLGRAWTDAELPDEAGAMSDSALELTVGARVKHRVGAFDYRAETGVQLGDRLGAGGMASSVVAYHGEVEAGANLAGDALRLALAGFYASGDDPGTARNEAWDQLYPTAHKFLGYADVIGGRSNVAGGIARAGYQATPDVKLAADAHVFFRPERADDAGAYAGAELDTGAAYSLGKGLAVRAGYSLFLPSADHYPSDTAVHFVEAELRYDLP